tara:strand:- start:78 stop:251 length:174 start_codon:yes stop_codon:yes gene_type:complete
MIIKSNQRFSLIQTITDQLLLVVNGTVSRNFTPVVLRVWHISKKEEALNEWERYHDF